MVVINFCTNLPTMHFVRMFGFTQDVLDLIVFHAARTIKEEIFAGSKIVRIMQLVQK